MISTSVKISDLQSDEVDATTTEEGTWTQNNNELFLTCECTLGFCFGDVYKSMTLQEENGEVRLLGMSDRLTGRIILFKKSGANNSINPCQATPE